MKNRENQRTKKIKERRKMQKRQRKRKKIGGKTFDKKYNPLNKKRQNKQSWDVEEGLFYISPRLQASKGEMVH